jgi:hypothetical protein
VILGIAAGLLAVFASIRKQGKQAAQIEHLEKTLQNVRKRDEVTQKIERLPSGTAADRLRDKWSRD